MKITDVEAILLNPRLAARTRQGERMKTMSSQALRQEALRQDRHADPL